MIELIPAIDIIDGKCVRLTQGDYALKTIYSDSPAELAAQFESLGYKRIHVVDLDGARSRHIVNHKTLKDITSRTGLTVDFGGGIKSEDDMKQAFDCGASMVTVGSVAVTDKNMFAGWLDKYGADRIILGADVRNGKISINGWKDDSPENVIDFLGYYVSQGVRNVLCTDISKDGMMQGPAYDMYADILNMYRGVNLIASGGISSVDDIKRLDRLGVTSVVFGKAIYEGKVNLKTLKADVAKA